MAGFFDPLFFNSEFFKTEGSNLIGFFDPLFFDSEFFDVGEASVSGTIEATSQLSGKLDKGFKGSIQATSSLSATPMVFYSAIGEINVNSNITGILSSFFNISGIITAEFLLYAELTVEQRDKEIFNNDEDVMPGDCVILFTGR